jgi:hypothetical protein
VANSPDKARFKRLGAPICLIAQCLLSAVLIESSSGLGHIIAFALSRFCDRLEGAA